MNRGIFEIQLVFESLCWYQKVKEWIKAFVARLMPPHARHNRLPLPATMSTIAFDECERPRNNRCFKYPFEGGSSGTGSEIRYNFEGNFEIATLRG